MEEKGEEMESETSKMKNVHGVAEEKHRAGIQEFNPDSETLGWRCTCMGLLNAAGIGNLHFIEGIMNLVMYIDILKQNLRSSAM